MKCRQEVESFDVVVIGAGPGGTTVASYLIRAGLTVLLLEKQSFPRFHVGESLTGVAAEIIADFNLTDTVNSYDFPVKGGVKVIGKGAKNEFFVPVMRSTWQVRRAEFDRILLTHAKSQGVTYRQGHVKSVLKTGERVTGLTYGILEETDEGTRHVVTKTVHCQVVVDASGQSTVLSKLGVAGPRKKSDQFNNDVAVFAHYQGVERDPGTMGDNTRKERELGSPVSLERGGKATRRIYSPLGMMRVVNIVYNFCRTNFPCRVIKITASPQTRKFA